ncbi:MAG: hypothetical protein LEGION0403_FIIPPAGN_02834 [Legionella sp.]|uniref:ankyrin repeat domain-containing protein n=1 Tax=Legionella sp. TaxID=459 RepID=UPI003D0DEED6
MNKKLLLLEEINSMVSDSFSDDKKYKKSMEALLQQCSLETNVLIELAVKNNRLLILKSLMRLRKDINFEFKNLDKNQYLLEIAYDKHYLDIFKFLLEHKASPDIVCTNKSPILFCACVEERLEEMEILLEAKADPFAICPKGFASLGALVMRDDIIPNNDHVERFLICVRQTIDQQQGRTNQLSTPLAYVCQKGWEDTAKLLLSHGANPNIGRFDGVTPLGVCVYKNNFKLFQSIIENSTVPVKQGLSNALDVAVLFQTLENDVDKNCFIEEVIRYSKEHQLDLEIPSATDAAIRLEKCEVITPLRIHSISISTFFHNAPRSSYDSDEDEHEKITNHSINQ